MKISEQLAEDFQEATQQPDRSDCPDAETLAALAAGELPDDQRDELLDKVLKCSDCSYELKLAKESLEWARQTAGEQSRSSFGRWLMPALAMMVICGIGLALLWGPQQAQKPALRGQVIAVQPPSDTALEAAPEQLSWPKSKGAHSYRATLFDASGEQLLVGPWSPDSQLSLPKELRDSLSPGEYFWVVDLRGMVQRSQLGPFTFRIEE